MDREDHLPGPIDYLLIAVFGGIEVWANPPRLGGARLSVDRTKERERKEPVTPPPRVAAATPWPDTHAPTQDPLKRYHFLVQPAFGTGPGRPFTIAINQRTGRIDWMFTDRFAFAKEHRSAGLIGVALLSLPLAPPLYMVNRYYRFKEERAWGMSRHAKAILDGLRDELTAEERVELERAFRLEWEQGGRTDEAAPTYWEAYARLSTLRQQYTDIRDWHEEDAVRVRSYTWIDAEGNPVAHGREVGSTGTCSVSFGRSHFQGEEARDLIARFAERHHRAPEPNDG